MKDEEKMVFESIYQGPYILKSRRAKKASVFELLFVESCSTQKAEHHQIVGSKARSGRPRKLR